MKQLLPFLLLVLSSADLQAQELLHCGADEMRIQTLQANPRIAAAVIERDAELEAFTREYAASAETRAGGPIYTIPVVFHVIHKYGNENIGREQLLDGLRVVNETFRKTRADTADIVEAFKPIHADTEIEFRLATKDPDGNCHSGINRIASPLTTIGNHQVKELIHWDPSMYLNIYVVSNAAGLAGHCVWPADADTIPAWDGIVIAHNYVGTMGTSDPTRSLAFAHECGHYLNLHHIWGGNNVPGFYYLPVGQAANCNEDDLVDDTPNTKGWSSCVLGAASCGSTLDNVQNAMDYTYCNMMFTEGQKLRMHAALNSSIADRNNLWSNSNLIATGVLPTPAPLCFADFRSDVRMVCPNIDNQVTFSDESSHGDIDSYLWTFENGLPATSSDAAPIVTYTTPGKHDVTLQVFGGGTMETITKNDFITVLGNSSHTYPFSTSFEDDPLANENGWMENATSDDSFWTITDLAANSGSHSVWVDNWAVNTLTVNELYGPKLNLSDASQMRIAFSYAYGGTATPSNTTRLVLQVSRNCETNWSNRLTLVGDDLEAVAPQSDPYVPANATAWRQEVASVNTTFLEDGFRFRFVFTSEGNDRLFLDDINIDITAGVNELDNGLSEVVLYPNPTMDQLSVQFQVEKATDVTVSVVDLLGQTVVAGSEVSYLAGIHTSRTSVLGLSAGMYLLRLETDEWSVAKRFTIN